MVCGSFYDAVRSHTTSYVSLKGLNKFISWKRFWEGKLIYTYFNIDSQIKDVML
jgi:hypothetical protein